MSNDLSNDSIVCLNSTLPPNIYLYPANIFVLKMLSAYMSATNIQKHFRFHFIMEANTMNLIRLLLMEQSDLGP